MQHSYVIRGNVHIVYLLLYMHTGILGIQGNSRVQASCLHKAASLPEKSEEVRFYLIGNNLRSCIALSETEDARTEAGLYSWRGN